MNINNSLQYYYRTQKNKRNTTVRISITRTSSSQKRNRSNQITMFAIRIVEIPFILKKMIEIKW